MSNRYDLIGFSPRGVGVGTPLDCGAAIVPEVKSYSFYDRSPQNLQDLQNAARLQSQACINNPLSQHIHTDATARDMDLVRVLLGDDKLNYIGYSYGTWLGAWYASLFPERVGRMLLDSSTNIVDSFDGIFQLQEMGKQRLLDEVFLPYATRHPQRFNLGDSAAQLRSELVALSAKLKHLLFPEDESDDGLKPINWANPLDIDDSLFYIKAALGLQILLTQQPTADEGQIRAAITAHRFAPNPEINALAVERANKLADALFAKPSISPKKFSLEDAVFLSVRCNDTGTSGNAQHWIDIGNEYATRYPLTGGYSTANPCLYWPKSAVQRPPLAMAGKVGPLLMLQSRFDALTPIEGAQATLAALPNASMIVVENEFRHGLFPYGDECVDGQVAQYFLHGTMPPRLSSCEVRSSPTLADSVSPQGLPAVHCRAGRSKR